MKLNVYSFCMCICSEHASLVPTEGGIRSPMVLGGCWDLNLLLLEEQPMFLTVDPSLQSDFQ